MSLHIERMRKELAELNEKIEKGRAFWEKEEVVAEYTDEIQRAYLDTQMRGYELARDVLELRINYDYKKSGGK